MATGFVKSRIKDWMGEEEETRRGGEISRVSGWRSKKRQRRGVSRVGEASKKKKIAKGGVVVCHMTCHALPLVGCGLVSPWWHSGEIRPQTRLNFICLAPILPHFCLLSASSLFLPLPLTGSAAAPLSPPLVSLPGHSRPGNVPAAAPCLTWTVRTASAVF